MSKLLMKSLLVSPAAIGAAFVMSASAMAADLKANPDAPATDAAVSLASSVEQSSVAPVDVKAGVKVAQAAPDSNSSEPVNNVSSLDQLNRYAREGRSTTTMSQVTSVSQLSDVKPTDWAFQALQSLVERYGCIVGYPDKTYRGNRATSRYEFAAGLNACLNRISELIASSTADLVRKEDLAVLQKLQEEFAAELATLRGRVDSLEARTATLEKQQFSTTTKLAGEVIFAITDEFRQPVKNNTVFQDRVRLALNTSFTGKDLLVTRLAAGNAGTFSFAGAPGSGAEGIQTFNFGNTGGNSVFADWVAYFFPVGDILQFYIPAVGGLQYDYAPTLSGLMEAADSGTGPLSVFAQRNPIYQIGGGSGIGVTATLGGVFKVSAGYLADNSSNTGTVVAAANNPATKNGLFNGNYAALGQIAFDTGTFGIGATYVNAYRRNSIFDTGNGGPGSGTLFANGTGAFTRTFPLFGTGVTPSTVNAYGVQGYIKLGSSISLNAYGSYIKADGVRDGFTAADIWTYGLGLAFADFGKRGNLLGFSAGVEPYVANPRQFGLFDPTTGIGARRDRPYHLEAFYKFQLTDNISITPGVIYIINPGQDRNNTDALIGTLRTTFTF
jgi:BMFP domain-containing protein YqiC